MIYKIFRIWVLGFAFISVPAALQASGEESGCVFREKVLEQLITKLKNLDESELTTKAAQWIDTQFYLIEVPNKAEKNKNLLREFVTYFKIQTHEHNKLPRLVWREIQNILLHFNIVKGRTHDMHSEALRDLETHILRNAPQPDLFLPVELSLSHIPFSSKRVKRAITLFIQTKTNTKLMSLKGLIQYQIDLERINNSTFDTDPEIDKISSILDDAYFDAVNTHGVTTPLHKGILIPHYFTDISLMQTLAHEGIHITQELYWDFQLIIDHYFKTVKPHIKSRLQSPLPYTATTEALHKHIHFFIQHSFDPTYQQQVVQQLYISQIKDEDWIPLLGYILYIRELQAHILAPAMIFGLTDSDIDSQLPPKSQHETLATQYAPLSWALYKTFPWFDPDDTDVLIKKLELNLRSRNP